MPNAAYAPTKLVGHWLTKHIHLEEPEITAFPICPGFVTARVLSSLLLLLLPPPAIFSPPFPVIS